MSGNPIDLIRVTLIQNLYHFNQSLWIASMCICAFGFKEAEPRCQVFFFVKRFANYKSFLAYQ